MIFGLWDKKGHVVSGPTKTLQRFSFFFVLPMWEGSQWTWLVKSFGSLSFNGTINGWMSNPNNQPRMFKFPQGLGAYFCSEFFLQLIQFRHACENALKVSRFTLFLTAFCALKPLHNSTWMLRLPQNFCISTPSKSSQNVHTRWVNPECLVREDICRRIHVHCSGSQLSLPSCQGCSVCMKMMTVSLHRLKSDCFIHWFNQNDDQTCLPANVWKNTHTLKQISVLVRVAVFSCIPFPETVVSSYCVEL